MKASYVLNILLAAVLAYVCIRHAENNPPQQMMDDSTAVASSQVSPVASDTFKKFDVMSEPDSLMNFSFFTGDGGHGLLLCAGDTASSNAMTIGWGGIGTLWGMQRPVVTVYVAERRYTKEFMDKYGYFTIMHFADTKILDYMGTHSGRDGDKAKELGLHTLYTENGTPYYAEADLVLECRKMYDGHQFDSTKFCQDAPKEFYANFPAGIHYFYIGDVVNAWRK